MAKLSRQFKLQKGKSAGDGIVTKEHKAGKSVSTVTETNTTTSLPQQAVTGSHNPSRSGISLASRSAEKMYSAQSPHQHDLTSSQPRSKASNGRRSKQRSASSRSPQASSTSTGGAYQTYRPGLWTWIDHVPQSKDDQTIVRNIQQVFTYAEQYVNNYYLDTLKQRPCQLPFFERQAFQNLPPEISIADILCDVVQPSTVIKHCLIALLLNSISFDGEGPIPSLLPAEFTSLARAIQNNRADDSEIQHFDAAFASSRVLAHYLRSNVNKDGCFIKARDKSIHEIAARFEATFAPWVKDRRDPDRRLPALVDLLRQTSDLGILLFSQPSSFLFEWQVKDSASRDIEIAIAPRLLKMSDENAQDIDPAQLMMRLKTEKTGALAQQPQRKEFVHAAQKYLYETNAPEVSIAKRYDHSNPSIQTIPRKPLVPVGPPVNIPPSDPLPPILSRQDAHPAYELAGKERPHVDRRQISSEESKHHQVIGSSMQTPVHEIGTSRELIPPCQKPPQNPHVHPGSHTTFDQGDPRILSSESRTHTQNGASNWQQEPGKMAFTQNGSTRFPQHIPMNDWPGEQAHDIRPFTTKVTPPNAYREGNGHNMVRSSSMDRGRTNLAPQRARKRSTSAGGPPITRALTWDTNLADGREAQIPNQIPLGPAQHHGDMCSESDRTRDHWSSMATSHTTAIDELHPGHNHNAKSRTDASRRERKDRNGTHEERHHATDGTRHSTSDHSQSAPSVPVRESRSTMRQVTEPPKSKRSIFSKAKAKVIGERI